MLLDMDKYKAVARKMVAEGCVLLKNDSDALPLKTGEKVALFGRCAFNYYKSGLGSGGLVNTKYTVGILDALKECNEIEVNEDILEIYEEWLKDNPYDKGNGWGAVPWAQKEMPVTDNMLQLAKNSDVSLVIIGRTAGEDQDNKPEAGSFYLTDVEYELIDKVTKASKRTVVVLNVGNIIDSTWISKINPEAVLYAWQGGQEGGHGVADVLTGKVNPTGKLTDTIAYELSDYPSYDNFGDPYKNCYKEDIFVGYRYFETFAKDRVLYPFGYGLSYTEYDITDVSIINNFDEVTVKFKVTNTGQVSGKETVFLFTKQPQGVLGKPEIVITGFAKTGELAPGQSQQMEISVNKYYYSSYDDAGKTIAEFSYVLEAGEYKFFVGKNIRDLIYAGSVTEEFRIMDSLSQNMAPLEAFERLTVGKDNEKVYEKVTVRKHNLVEKIYSERPEKIEYTGNMEYKFSDVYYKKVTMNEFVAQLTVEDCVAILHGEGMCSSRVTPGTASAFAGVTDRLSEMGIPAVCCADGPSGVRMDCGTKAFSIPNGTSIACSFDLELAEELYTILGTEMRKNKVDTLLGPGINIHRHPLNGRNFEYFSEDPYVTGMMCAAQLKGLNKAGVTGTIKHFCANNQEHYRHTVESVVSERALREIYLKTFEIAVKEGNARSVMTAYNPVNGIWTAGNYELCTSILREEWGYKGIVMTDWWAKANWENDEASIENRASMVRAQNDIFMCSNNVELEEGGNIYEMLEKGVITFGELQRNATNVLEFALSTPAMLRKLGKDEEVTVLNDDEINEGEVFIKEMESFKADKETGEIVINADITGEAGKFMVYELAFERLGSYEVTFEVTSDLSPLAQLPISVFLNNLYKTTLSFNGTEGGVAKQTFTIDDIVGRMYYLKLAFGADALKIKKIILTHKATS